MQDTTIGNVTFRNIRNVQQCSFEEGTFFAEVEMSVQNSEFTWEFYCARSDDLVETGKFVYQQIIDGNFEGEITATEISEVEVIQPTVSGAQSL